MKLIFVLLLFQCTSLMEAQNKEDRISKLDNHCAEILRQLSRYTGTVEVSETFGSRIKYQCAGTVKLIALKVQQDSILKKVIWILEQNQLIYAQQEWLNVKTNSLTDAQKFYQEDQHLYAWLNNGSFVDPHSEVFEITQKEFLAYIPKLLK